MKRSIPWVVVALALAAHPIRAQDTKEAAEAVQALERAWLDAYENHDAEAMDAIVADDFTITFPDGSIETKPELLEWIRQPRESDSPSVRFRTEDVEARVYGATVVLIGRVVAEYTRSGETTAQESRYTDTYVQRDGRWQVVASHLSNVQEEDEPANTPE
jgi:uncharacterized protein (TIGR02246 family)